MNKWSSVWALLGWVWLVAIVVVFLIAVIGNMYSGGFVLWFSFVGTPVVAVLLLLFTVGFLLKTYLDKE